MTPLGIAVLVVWCAALALFALVGGLFLSGVDRKLAAHMQARIGPPIRQPFIDAVKLLQKESIVPANAIPGSSTRHRSLPWHRASSSSSTSRSGA